MSKRDELIRKRNQAINQLRATGMTDEEIEEALGVPLDIESEDGNEIIDAEVVSVHETHERSAAIGETPGVALVPIPRQAPRPGHEDAGKAADEPTIFTEEWWETVAPNTKYRRCAGHSSRTGLRCKQQAMMGTTVCRFHGGAAPHVQRAAKVRLDMAADRMAANLLGLAEYSGNDAIRLGATNSALDRAGIIRPTKVEVGPIERQPYEEIFDSISGGSRAESRAARGMTAEDSDPRDDEAASAEGYEIYTGEDFDSSDHGYTDRPTPRPPRPARERGWSAEDAVAQARRANTGRLLLTTVEN